MQMLWRCARATGKSITTGAGDMWVHKTLIVPAALRDQCAALCAQLAGSGGARMFAAPLYSGGALSHYLSSGLIEESFADLLLNVDALFSVCQSAGLPITKPELTAILHACDISDGDAQTAITRMGLSLPTLGG